MSFHALGAAAADALGAALPAAADESVGAAEAEGMLVSGVDADGAVGAAGCAWPPPHAIERTGTAQARAKAMRTGENFMAGVLCEPFGAGNKS